MTVIVAVPGAMYSDSICVRDDEYHFPSTKIYRIKGGLVGVAGNVPSIEKFLRWYSGTRKKPLELTDTDSFDVVVVDDKGIWDYGSASTPDKVLREYHGCGSGWSQAEVALICGTTPQRAIEIVCQVNRQCGLPVQEFKL